MKRSIWRNKKGQIQGVDFALSMIVFMILFAEVIVLSLSFLEPKYQNLDSRAFESKAEQISDTFFASAGYPSDWEYDYVSEFNSFGLRESDSLAMDANKLSRINSQSLYSLSYLNLKGNISREQDIGFRFQIESLFDVDSTLSITQPTGSVLVETTIGNCDVWIFVISPDGSIYHTTRDQTNSSGLLSHAFSTSGLLPDGYYTSVVFAQSDKGVFAVDYFDAVKGTYFDSNFKVLIQEDSSNNGLAQIQTSNNGSLSTLTATIVYPYANGEELLANESFTISSPTTSENFSLRMPTNGTCAVILSGDAAAGDSRDVQFYPTQLNEKFGSTFGEAELPSNDTIVKIEKIISVRECIYKAVLYVWSES